MISFSSLAQSDLWDIWVWNAENYGSDHADRYLRFLLNQVRMLSRTPLMGQVIRERGRGSSPVIRKKGKGYGHLAFYRVGGENFEVIRVLHTARDWPDMIERYEA